MNIWCYECGGYAHPWPPCDLNQDGSARDPQPCGHRRPFRGPDGCKECKRIQTLRKKYLRHGAVP